jgi:hypothetical protein
MKKMYTNWVDFYNPPKNHNLSKSLLLCWMIVFSFAFSFVNAQTFNYGTGSVASNTAPFNTLGGAGITVAGNDITVTANVNMTSGIYNFANFTINSGVIVTVVGNAGPLIIRCTGNFVNNGELRAVPANAGNASGATAGAAGVAIAGGVNGGIGGAGGANGTSTTGPGANFFSSTARGLQGCGLSPVRPSWGGPGGGGGGYGTAGANGGNASGVGTGCATGGVGGTATYGSAALTANVGASATYQSLGATAAGNRWLLAGCSGAGGHGTQSIVASARAAGGGGGASGGAIQIAATNVTIGTGAWIRCRGGNGGNGSLSSSTAAAGGGGGGGAGGTINIQYFSSYTNTGNAPQVSGGIGGLGQFGGTGTGGSGGNGGSGRVLVEQDIVLCTAPTIQATSFSFSNVTTTSADITFNRGNGDGGVLVVARAAAAPQAPTGGTAYTANSVFGSGSTTAAGSYVVYNSNAAGPVTFNVSGLTPGTSYQFSVHEWNTAATCYLNPGLAGTVPIPVCLPPNTQASGFLVTPSTNSANMSWTPGNGTAGDLVVLRQGAAVSGDPVQTTAYTPNLAFGSGTALGSGFVVKAGTGGTANVTNLLPNTIYHYAIYTYNTSGPCYQLPAITGSFTTLDGPMTYSPSTVTQSSVASMTLGAANQQIVQIQLNTGPGTSPPLTLSSLNFNTNGSTLGATVGNDISTARVFYNTTNTLTGAVQFGSNITSFPGGSTAITVSGSQVLQPNSNNYFFIVYDVSIGATTGNVLDGEITSITYTDGVTPFTVAPSPTTAPAGTRTITGLMSVTCGYTYSNFAATWTSNVGQAGTTVVASGAASIDDQRWPSQTFTPGFTFEYNGTVYNSFGIHSKGFIWFGTTNPSGLAFTPISSATAYEGAIAAFAFDMQAHSSSTTPPQVSVRYTGTAPNRICTIEWTAMRPFGNTGGICPGFGSPTDWNRYDIQLQLNENGGTNSNRIDIVLRDMNGFCVNANGASAQVGLRGSSNADFLNRAGSGNTGHTASTAGTLNTSVISHGANNYFNGNGGLRFTPTFQKPTITPSPTAANVCPTADVALSTTSPVVNKQWFNNNLAISGATAASYTATASGNHLVMVTQGACSKLSIPTAVTITPCVSNTITTNDVAATICAGGILTVNFTATGTYTAGNVYTAQLSNASGSFLSPVSIGTLSSTSNGSLAISATISSGTATGLGYKIRVISSNPSITGTETAAFEVLSPAPTISISNPSAGCAPGTVDITGAGIVTVTNGAIVSGTSYWLDLAASSAFTGNPNAVTNSDPSVIYVKYENSCGNDVEPISVSFNNSIITSHTSVNPSTCAGSNGSINLSGLLATTSYSVVYHRNGPPSISAGTITTNGSGQLLLSGLADGLYDNIVVTRLSCASAAYPASGTISLTDPVAPVVSSTSSINPTTCLGTDGSIQLNGLLATTNYNVSYDKNGSTVNAGSIGSNGSGSLLILGLGDGNYDNIFVSLSGCNSSPVPSSGVIALDPPASPSITSNTLSDPTSCSGNNGTISLQGLSSSTVYTVAYIKNSTPVNGGSISTNGSGVLTISSLSSGTYTNFVVTNALGCASNAYPNSGTIVLSDPPAPSINSFVANDPATCSGANGSISIGGLLNATAYNVSYRRNNGSVINAGSITSNGSGILVIPSLIQGAYDNIVVSNSNCFSDPYPVSGDITLTDPPLPILATGNSVEICGSGSVVLGASGASLGEDYNWYSTLTGSSLEQSGGSSFGTAVLSNTTNYFVTIFNTSTLCESASRTVVTATIYQEPTSIVTGSLLACSSSTLSSSSSTAGSGSIISRQWLESGNPIALANGVTYVATASGNYSVIISNSNGCSTTSAVSSATVNAAATATSGGNAISCENGTVTVTGASASNNSGVSWTHNGAGFLLNANTLSPTYTCGLGDGGNTVTLTLTAQGVAPCANASATFTINVRPRPAVTVSLGPNTICNDGFGTARKLEVSNIEANTTYLWSPIGDLYLDAAFSIPYTGQNVTEVWAVPFGTISYSVTATNDVTLCTTPASAPVTLTVCTNLTNDICGAALLPVSTTGSWTNITLLGSTSSGGAPCAIVERDVFRKVVVPASGEIHVTTAVGTNANASLNVQRTLVSIHYGGNTCITSPQVACNSTGAAGNQSYVSHFGMTPGDTAWIRIAKSKALVTDPNTPSQFVRVNVAPALTWTGTANTAFTNASNWLNGDATSLTVPDLNKSVLIRQVTNAPVLSSNEQIRGLIMTANAGLTVNAGNTLSVSRRIETANNTIGGAGFVVLNGTAAQALAFPARFNYLRVNNSAGVIITAVVRVGGLDLQQGVVTTNNNLTLLSDAGLTGYLNNFTTGYTGSLSPTSNLNVERRVVLGSTSNASPEHYLSSPVAMIGTVTSNYNDDFPVVGSPANYIYNTNPNLAQPATFPSTWTYDETQTAATIPGWTGAGATTLAPGQGFSARIQATRVIDILGIPNNAGVNRTVTLTDDGLNLIGNPYPSSINFSSFASANASTILPVLYIWNPANSSYASYAAGIWSNNPAGLSASDVIGHSQSFFVFATQTGPVSFSNSMRTANQTANFFAAPEGLIRLEVSSNGQTDEAVVATNTEATENYDSQVDAKKLLNALTPSILAFTLSADNTPLAINAMDKFSTEQVIPVQIIATTAGEVNIKLNMADLKGRFDHIYLEDATLGTYTDLKARESYTATVSQGNSGSRFFLHFEKPSIAKAANEFGVYAANTTVFANLPSESNGTIEVVDLVGKTIYTANFAGKSGRVAFEIPNAVYGSYIVKLTSNGKVINQKVIFTE